MGTLGNYVLIEVNVSLLNKITKKAVLEETKVSINLPKLINFVITRYTMLNIHISHVHRQLQD